MAILYYPLREVEGIVFANLYADTQLFIVGDTDAEKPTTGLQLGWRYFAKDNFKLYKATGQTTWVEIGAGGSVVVFENRTVDPVSPAVGECWLRTDL